MKIGDVVRWKEPLGDDEAAQRMVVHEGPWDDGRVVLRTPLLGWDIQPLTTARASEVEVVQEGGAL